MITGEGPHRLAQVLSAAGVNSIAVDGLLVGDEQPAALDVPDHVAQVASQGDAVVLAVGREPGETMARLDAAAAAGLSRLIIVVGGAGSEAATHAAAWAARGVGWLALDDPPAGLAVLASPATIANSPNLPGTWRRPRRQPPTRLEPAALPQRATPAAQQAEIDRLRAALAEQREWVAQEAERARSSTSWRVGHRLVRAARTVTFRHDRGTDALARLAQRMRAPSDL